MIEFCDNTNVDKKWLPSYAVCVRVCGFVCVCDYVYVGRCGVCIYVHVFVVCVFGVLWCAFVLFCFCV